MNENESMERDNVHYGVPNYKTIYTPLVYNYKTIFEEFFVPKHNHRQIANY